MKTKTKVVLLALCMAAIIVVSVLGTMAYLTSTDEVTNTFTVGQVSITMDEATVDVYGVAVENAARTDNNRYKLLPGHQYLKDPTIHVGADSEDCYLFVEVVNTITGLEDSSNTIASQMATNGWTPVTGATNIYAYRSVVSANNNIPVFSNFTIAGNADLSNFNTATNMIKVTAYAVQKYGFDTAQAAWDATFGKAVETTAEVPNP